MRADPKLVSTDRLCAYEPPFSRGRKWCQQCTYSVYPMRHHYWIGKMTAPFITKRTVIVLIVLLATKSTSFNMKF